ncbi:hypothetical protein [Mucilaginibacter aquariorum]|uniref:Uncharacterized protein n=1 Tax=Mucilaginibacter aquariorum TaxID=2967225 RepID=A0ABT1TAC1_9SPHI|nr:hypothetical protein [Mucilaginibacter aquariorum]MCQ6961325.1 hypothetical protein [Mucilaginibacter aquariorum]
MKFVGNGKRISFNQYNGNFSYSGQCISFYPSGKRKSIINYGDFGKEGFEYWYYPNGKMFKLIKNEANENRKFFPNGELIDFYDTNGAQICKDGFGNSIEYDQLSKETVMEGPIVNGKKEGAWTGKIPFIDSGKYVLVYKNDEPISGLGYDSLGKSYSFNEVFSTTEYINGPTNFISEIKKSLKAYNLPKADIDSAILSFIVDESGRLMQLSTLKPTTPELLKALKESLSKQPNWSPTKLYGVPLKTKVILALNISHGHKGNSYFTKLIYTLRPLYKEKELNISHLMSTYMNKNSIIRR